MTKLRSLTCFATFLLQEAATDPVGLARKVSLKFGTRLTPAWSGRSAATRYEQLGELSRAHNEAKRINLNPIRVLSNGMVYNRLKRQSRLFEAPILSNETCSFPSENPRVVHVLGNSFPFTNSGYSQRSHAVLLASQAAGIEVAAQTRLGYPMVVGALANSEIQIIDGVEYHRSIPWIFPHSVERYIQQAVARIVSYCLEKKANCLQTTTGFINAIVVSRAAVELGIPWIYEVRGELEKTWLSQTVLEGERRSETSDFYRLSRAKEEEAMKSANRVVVLSDVVRDQLLERGIEENKIYVIPNAADSELISQEYEKDAIRTELEIPSGFWIGSVTSVVEYEGLDTLIKSLLYLPDFVKVLIVGDGSERKNLELLVDQLDLRTRVLFAGKKPQEGIWKWYAALDVFVIPRNDDPVCRSVTPIKPLAAMALGVPVVTSALPALIEVTGGLAVYFPSEEPESLSAAILNIATNGYDTSKARTWVAGRTWTQTSQQLSELYTVNEERKRD